MVHLKRFNEEFDPLSDMLSINIEDIANYIQSKYPEWNIQDVDGFKVGIQALIDKFIPHPYKVPSPDKL